MFDSCVNKKETGQIRTQKVLKEKTFLHKETFKQRNFYIKGHFCTKIKNSIRLL